MKRLLIYFLYDKDGIVDDYIPYFLSEVKPFCEDVCVVVNGDLNAEGYKKLTDCSDKLLLRENIGFDSWAYKHALEYYGFEKIKEYDELIMCNFTFFGPIFPLSEMFDKMTATKCDFWGIHRHPAMEAYMGQTKITEHIQSHFIVIRQSILKDDSFKEYWDTLKEVNSYEDAVAFHELRFTSYFESKGFVSDCYIDKEKYFKLLNSNSSVFLAGKQIIEDKCPILKRKVFATKNKKLEFPQEDTTSVIDILKFVEDKTTYPIKLILENIFRCFYCRMGRVPLLKIVMWRIKSKLLFSKHKKQKYNRKLESYSETVKMKKLFKEYKLGSNTFNFFRRIIDVKYDGKRYIFKFLFFKFPYKYNKFKQLELYKPNVKYIGKNSYTGYDVFIADLSKIIIGNFTSIGNNVRLGHGEHPQNYLTTSPYIYFDELHFKSPEMKSHPEFWHYKPIVIGHDVWIGDNVWIKNGVHIGNGAIIGAGAVVTKDVPPYAVVAGVPAKIIKYRFDEATIKKLLDLEWWFLPDDIIKQIPYDDIENAIEFLEQIEKKENKIA